MPDSDTTQRIVRPPGRRHDAGDHTREMTVLDIVRGRDQYPPRHLDGPPDPPAARRPAPVGEGSRIIAVPLAPRVQPPEGLGFTKVLNSPNPVRGAAPVPAPKPAPAPWWRRTLDRLRFWLGVRR